MYQSSILGHRCLDRYLEHLVARDPSHFEALRLRFDAPQQFPDLNPLAIYLKRLPWLFPTLRHTAGKLGMMAILQKSALELQPLFLAVVSSTLPAFLSDAQVLGGWRRARS